MDNPYGYIPDTTHAAPDVRSTGKLLFCRTGHLLLMFCNLAFVLWLLYDGSRHWYSGDVIFQLLIAAIRVQFGFTCEIGESGISSEGAIERQEWYSSQLVV